MDVWTPVITGALLAVFTVVIGLLNKVQFDAMKTQVDGLKDDVAEFKAETRTRFDLVDRRFDRVDDRLDRVDDRLDRVDARIDQQARDFTLLRTEFTQLVLALVPRTQPQAG